MKWLLLAAILVLGAYVIYRVFKYQRRWEEPEDSLTDSERQILRDKVLFYRGLDKQGQDHFEFKVREFLANCSITGAGTAVTDQDRMLVAASAIIPIYAFPEWKYTNLDEVILYPNRFNHDFETEGHERPILGMVGTGYMDRKMILSKPALYLGFENVTDKRNTAIHEFVHLVDKLDGSTDGVPKVLLDHQYAIPWIDLMDKEYKRLLEGHSDVDPYGGTNKAEFFAVLGEYFFERPHLFKSKHPELYEGMSRIFGPKPGNLE